MKGGAAQILGQFRLPLHQNDRDALLDKDQGGGTAHGPSANNNDAILVRHIPAFIVIVHGTARIQHSKIRAPIPTFALICRWPNTNVR